MRHLRAVGAANITVHNTSRAANITVHNTSRSPIAGARARRAIRLWLPLTPLLLVLGPLVMIASPLAALTRSGRRIGPVRTAWAMGGLLLALSGTRFSVDTQTVQIRIHIL